MRGRSPRRSRSTKPDAEDGSTCTLIHNEAERNRRSIAQCSAAGIRSTWHMIRYGRATSGAAVTTGRLDAGTSESFTDLIDVRQTPEAHGRSPHQDGGQETFRGRNAYRADVHTSPVCSNCIVGRGDRQLISRSTYQQDAWPSTGSVDHILVNHGWRCHESDPRSVLARHTCGDDGSAPADRFAMTGGRYVIAIDTAPLPLRF